VVGGIASERQPPLPPPYQGGESFSSRVVSRKTMNSSLGMTAYLRKDAGMKSGKKSLTSCVLFL